MYPDPQKLDLFQVLKAFFYLFALISMFYHYLCVFICLVTLNTKWWSHFCGLIIILFPLFSHTHITHDITRRCCAGSHRRTVAEKSADSIVHLRRALRWTQQIAQVLVRNTPARTLDETHLPVVDGRWRWLILEASVEGGAPPGVRQKIRQPPWHKGAWHLPGWNRSPPQPLCVRVSSHNH